MIKARLVPSANSEQESNITHTSNKQEKNLHRYFIVVDGLLAQIQSIGYQTDSAWIRRIILICPIRFTHFQYQR